MEAALQKAIAALAEAPDDYIALARVRRLLLGAGRFWALARTMQWWAAQAATAPERAEGYLEAADAVLMANPKALDTVLALLRQALHQDPRQRSALFRLERLCRQGGDVRSLREALSLVIADAQKRELPAKHYVHLLEHLARVYAHDLKLPQRATDCYREILRLVPEHENAPRQLAHLLVDRQLGPRPVPALATIEEPAVGPGDLYAVMNAAEQQQSLQVDPFVPEFTTRPRPVPAAPARTATAPTPPVPVPVPVPVPDDDEDESRTNLINRNVLVHQMPTSAAEVAAANVAIDVDFSDDEATSLRESPAALKALDEEQAESTRRLERPIPIPAAKPSSTAALPEPRTVRLNRPVPAPLKRKRVEPPAANTAPEPAPLDHERTTVSEPPPSAEAPPTVPPKRKAGRRR